jgi:peroxiredoxin
VIAVRDHLDQLGDALPVVVTFTDDWRRLAAYREHLDVEFPVLADVDRVLYDLLGAGRGSIRNVWSPGTLAMYARLLLRGRRLHVPTEDTRQLGADAIIGRDGRLRRVWLPESPDARPPIETIIDAVRDSEE